MVKNLPALQETWVQSLGWEDPLEKEVATHSSIFPWKIPWTDGFPEINCFLFIFHLQAFCKTFLKIIFLCIPTCQTICIFASFFYTLRRPSWKLTVFCFLLDGLCPRPAAQPSTWAFSSCIFWGVASHLFWWVFLYPVCSFMIYSLILWNTSSSSFLKKVYI